MKKLLLLTLCIQLQAYDFNFKQIEEDKQRIEAAGYSYNFDFQNPKHKYFLIINILDVATTVYGMEHRNSLHEQNFLLDNTPEIEELILQKAIVITALNYIGIFSNHPDDAWYINSVNTAVTLAAINNLYLINKYD